MSGWQYMILALGSIAAIVLSWWELRRPRKARLAWRIGACVIAVASLVLMEMQQQWSAGRAASGVAVIRTEGADPDSIRNFTRNRHGIAAVMTPEEWSGDNRSFDTVHVFGFGLRPGEKELLHHAAFRFHPSSPVGIIAAGWQRQLRQGERLVVNGSYQGRQSGKVMITLEAFGTVVDSVSLTCSAGQRTSFSMGCIPKNTGKAVYRLTAKQGSEIFDQNPIPVEIVPSGRVKLLILSSSPDFEMRFLKDWLARKGYPVAEKTLVSANKFERAAYNASHLLPSEFSIARPDSFDVIVSDPLTLRGLSPADANNIRHAVSGNGVGLILRSDTITAKKDWYEFPFALYTASPASGQKTGQQIFLRESPSARALRTDSLGHIVAGDALFGQGKLLFTTVNNSYEWWLSGNTEQYESFWSELIEKASERRSAVQSYYETERFPFVDEPMRVSVYPAGNADPQILINSRPLAPEQENWYDGKWDALTWPRTTGWQSASQSLPDPFVFQAQQWPAVQAIKRIENNYIYSAEAGPGTTIFPVNRVPVPWFWFFLPFIICCAFLWAEPKIFPE